jgi:subtilisin family serine protease
MEKIIGKEKLCSVETRYFKSIQGIEEKTLFDRYPSIENFIKTEIDDKYKHFLAQPVKNSSSIIWYGKKYDETPILLSELQGEKSEKYNRIKDETLTYYRNKINALRQSGEKTKADFLAKATKFIDDRFIFCYDDIVVLSVWGMQLRNDVRETTGIVMKNLVVPVMSGEQQVELPVETPDEPDPVDPVDPVDPPDDPPKPVDPDPPKKRFWSWFTWRGCLKWLLWLLLLLLLLLLFWWLFRSCSGRHDSTPIPDPIDGKPWIDDDPNVRDGGSIYDPGNPYTPAPTPPDYGDVLPPRQGILPPIEDDLEIIPGNPTIIGNRLNILMENRNKSIMDLAMDFKAKYPDDKYTVIYYDDVIKRMQIKIPKEERERLKQEIPGKFAPNYELFVFDEALFEGNYTPNDPAFADSDKSWYLHAIKAPQAWDITRGSPKLTVAVVDNGFNLSHPELKSKVVMPYNVWTHSNKIFPQQVDHGTHVAGTALAVADNGKGICGIAPGCAFMPVQVADARGLMTTTSILDGILYALYQGADVVNVSLGTSFASLDQYPENYQLDLIHNHFKEEERLWREIMRIAARHNSTIVVAAGNDNVLAGIEALQRPELFVTVSAVDKNSRNYSKANFSNYGSYSTISAPGVDIYSSVGKNDYLTMSGTSMAAPIVTGAIALMKSVNDSITSKQIICILQNTGLPTQDNIGKLIQLDKALEMVKSGETVDCTPVPSTGDVQILLNWNNYNDLDLCCIDPYGNSVWFKNPRVASGGRLEIDMNVEYPDSKKPVENIYWPDGGAPNGTYEVYLLYYKRHETGINETPYTVKVKYGDKTEDYNGLIKQEDDAVHICTFTLGNGNNLPNPNRPNPDNPLNRRSHLEQERKRLQRELERLQQELDMVNEELKQIENNR